MRTPFRSTLVLLLPLLLALPACDSEGPGTNRSPSVRISFSPADVRAGEVVRFTAEAEDPDGEIRRYSWDFDGDGVEDSNDNNPNHVYAQGGTYRVSLTVTDNRSAQSSASRILDVAPASDN